MGEFPLLVAGETGQASLARSADSHGLRACLDQHVAEVRDALDGQIREGQLLSYARGFVEAAVARGWWPPHRIASPGPATESLAPASTFAAPDGWQDPDSLHDLDGLQDPDSLQDPDGWHPDWESLRLAAVCHLFLESQGLTPVV